MRIVGLALALFALTAPVFAQREIQNSADAIAIKAVPGASVVAPGADLPIGIQVSVAPGWHVWTNERKLPESVAQFDGAIFTALRIVKTDGALRFCTRTGSEWIEQVPTGDEIADLLAQWPEFHTVKADVGDGVNDYAVFEGEFTIFVPVSVAPDASSGKHTLEMELELQACNDKTCVAPAVIPVSIEVEVVPGAPTGALPAALAKFDPQLFASIHSGAVASTTVDFDFFGAGFSIDPSGGGFVLLLLVAAMGGVLLNFTPCVLPVIPLKIMGLSRIAGNRRKCFVLGAALSIGVILFWIGLGLAVSLLSGFTSSSQLFQYPLFTVCVGVVIAVMAVGMCGFFSVQLPQSIAGIEFRHDTMAGSVGFGVMTAVLSTPCTAPLMGAAAAWASTQPPTSVLAVFASIGSGMALPYLILSAFPVLVHKVPRSGPSSDLVKQTMGLLLLAAAAYFVGSGVSGWIVDPPTPPSKNYWWAVSALGVAAGGWLAIRTFMLTRSRKLHAVFCSLGLFVVAVSGAIGFRLTDNGRIDWVYYTPQRLAETIDKGGVVIIDFTAEWCLNCKTLENTVLESDSVVNRIEDGAITAIKVDLTGNNTQGRDLLKSYGRVTIPLLVILDRNGREIFKSDAYTPGQVTEALSRAAGNQ